MRHGNRLALEMTIFHDGSGATAACSLQWPLKRRHVPACYACYTHSLASALPPPVDNGKRRDFVDLYRLFPPEMRPMPLPKEC